MARPPKDPAAPKKAAAKTRKKNPEVDELKFVEALSAAANAPKDRKSTRLNSSH